MFLSYESLISEVIFTPGLEYLGTHGQLYGCAEISGFNCKNRKHKRKTNSGKHDIKDKGMIPPLFKGGKNMKITLETEYAIRIVDYLTRVGKLAGASQISEATAAPLRFTKNILQKLARGGIISSYKGIYGGYELGRLPEEISLYDVMEATEGPIRLNRCLGGKHVCSYAADKQRCPYYETFRELSDDMERKMRKFRFSSVVHDRWSGSFVCRPGQQNYQC